MPLLICLPHLDNSLWSTSRPLQRPTLAEPYTSSFTSICHMNPKPRFVSVLLSASYLPFLVQIKSASQLQFTFQPIFQSLLFQGAILVLAVWRCNSFCLLVKPSHYNIETIVYDIVGPVTYCAMHDMIAARCLPLIQACCLPYKQCDQNDLIRDKNLLEKRHTECR